MEAADEIPRQLKLRDLGGVIICDFIDLRFERHRRELEERLFENFKNDRAKTKVLRMSQFGIIEITRQRMRPSLKRSIYFDCPHCKGAGLIKTPESISLDVMRKVSIALADLKVVRVELSVCPDVAFYLLNKKRANLTELETRTKKKILIRTDASLGLDELKFELFDPRDFPVVLEEIGMTLPAHPHTSQLGKAPAGHTHQGRSGGRNQRGRNDRNGQGARRPVSVPARAMQDDDDLDEDLAAIDDRDNDNSEMDRDTDSRPEREEDPTDIPAILETEAGDEIAEDLADDELEQHEGDEPEEQFQPRQPQRNQPNQSRPQNRPDNRQPNQPQQNRPPGQFNNDQGPDGPGEGGRRRRRRRGRRGRGRGGQGGQGGQGQGMPGGQEMPAGQFEPNGNVHPDDRGPSDEYDDRGPADQAFDDSARDDAMPTNEAPLTDEGGGRPPVAPTGEGEATGDQPPRRRRRRRGGRRHRRRNAEGNPINGDQPPVNAPQDSSDSEDEFEPEDSASPESVEETPAEPAVEVEETTIVEETPVIEEPPVEAPEPEVKPKPKRASRAKAAPKVPKTPKVKATPKRTPPKKSAKAAADAAPVDVAVPADVVRTGSADKHLVSDEPVIPPSLSRPRSYSDLDAIPDDYD
jgi:hypothetical protein